ncbi:MAG: hypothetical protein FWG64_00430, partial [Firmicutes bacterium]|nr:hypothetical protein [Bacillota bacterium]
KIASAFSEVFGAFKRDKEAVKVLSFRDRYLNEGKIEGRYDTVNEIEKLLNSGLSLETVLQKIREETSLQLNNLSIENN